MNILVQWLKKNLFYEKYNKPCSKTWRKLGNISFLLMLGRWSVSWSMKGIAEMLVMSETLHKLQESVIRDSTKFQEMLYSVPQSTCTLKFALEQTVFDIFSFSVRNLALIHWSTEDMSFPVPFFLKFFLKEKYEFENNRRFKKYFFDPTKYVFKTSLMFHINSC